MSNSVRDIDLKSGRERPTRSLIFSKPTRASSQGREDATMSKSLTKPMRYAIEQAIAGNDHIPAGTNYNVVMGLW